MKKTSAGKIRGLIKAHKFWSLAVVLAVAVGAYGIYKSASTADAGPQYAIARVHTGTITQTVTGTGQVSAARQLDITSEVSGTIETIPIKVGQTVRAGQLLATIDDDDAADSLESAKIAYQKLIQPPTATELGNAENSLTKAYSDGFNSAATAFLDLPDIMTGMKNLLYGQNTFLSDQQSSYLISSVREYRDTAGRSYDRANNEYGKVLLEYKSLSRSSATSSVEQLLENTYSLTKNAAAALQDAQNAITYIMKVQPDYQESLAASAAADVNAWSSTINGAVTNLLSAKNSIESTENSLRDLLAGVDELDIQSQLLSLRQQEKNYQNYFIRAPFDGIIGRIPVNIYEKAGSGTVIATILGNQKIATISLNEIDAAKVKAGQEVAITFDAIDDLAAVGTVSEVDLVGTVTQGVVTYNVKIAIETDDQRILPGMSVGVTITTKRNPNVLVVPSSTVKIQGNRSFVHVIDNPPVPQLSTSTDSRSASSTFAARQNGIASSTRSFPAGNGSSQTLTVSSAFTPREVTVTTGDADDANTEITSGLSGGEWVVTRTIAATDSSQTASAPNILQSVGGTRTTSGGNIRTFTR